MLLKPLSFNWPPPVNYSGRAILFTGASMTKRAQSSGISPVKNKRLKTEDGQPRIDHFFASPTKAKFSTASHAPLPNAEASTSSTKTRKHANGQVEIIDVDAFESEDLVSLAFSKAEEEPPNSLTAVHIPQTPEASLSLGDYLPLNRDPTSYDPTSQPSNSPSAPYSLITHALVSLSRTRSRIAILNILTNLLRTVISRHPTSLLATLYLLSNSLGPQFMAIELGLGSSIISNSIRQISGLSSAALKRMYNQIGDPGDVAFEAKSNVRTLIPHPPLTVNYVYDSLLKISRCKGQGSGKEKQKIMDKLLLAAQGEEVRYLARTLFQNLRVGAVRTSILTALARAFVLTPPTSQPSSVADSLNSSNLREQFKKSEALLKQVYAKHPSYDQIIPALLEKGLDSLAERVPLSIGKAS